MSMHRANHLQSVKEIVRHSLFTLGGPALVKSTKAWRGLSADHLAQPEIGDRFARIYADNVWGHGGGSLSGPGSNPEVTDLLSTQLTELLARLKARRVTDIGCGDFGWMRNVHGDFRYTGLDIVPSLIDGLSREFQSETRRFLHLDATRDALPEGDVAVCREVLFHLSFEDVWRVVQNVKRSGYSYLLATSDSNIWFNANISSGDHRPLNLQRAPFRFPSPFATICDDKVSDGRYLCAWPVSGLPDPG